MKKFASRKFLAFVGTICTVAGSALSGEITWSQAVWPMVIALLGYLGIEGAADIKAAQPKGG